MHRSRRGLVVASLALALALIAFAGTSLQFGMVLEEALFGEARAQSSVRPPDDAVNLEETPVPVPSPSGEATEAPASSVRPPPDAATNAPSAPGTPRAPDQVERSPAQPGALEAQGFESDSNLWGAIRQGAEGTVSIPDKKLGVLVDSSGTGWLRWREKGGPLQEYGAWVIGGMLVLLALFFLIRGRIRIQAGKSGVLIQRFTGIERFAHWTLATSFILLALTGLNLLYGKDWIMPYVGKAAFADVSLWGKWLHNNIAWPFMLALLLIFVMWVIHNLPTWTDVKWLVRAGGLFSKHSHPSSRKFNAGQKLVFWATVLLGASVSASGLALLFPYEIPMFAKTFVILNDLGVEAIWGSELATELTRQQEQQYAQIWHSYVGITMIAIILAHIYIGTLGMEGAFAAMGSGWVDRNWAKEHHDLWVEEKDRSAGAGQTAGQPAAHPAE